MTDLPDPVTLDHAYLRHIATRLDDLVDEIKKLRPAEPEPPPVELKEPSHAQRQRTVAAGARR